jgi:nucleoside-diphosphate-sugar epimerase
MRVFLAGATGVLGTKLIPKLLERGHDVIGTSNTSNKLSELKRSGVDPLLMDGLDRDSVFTAVSAAAPDVVVNEMTALSRVRNYKNFDHEFALTNRLRVEGTSHLLAASKQYAVKKIVIQSFAGWPFDQTVALANSEEAPFDPGVPVRMRRSQRAIQQMEEMVLSQTVPVAVVLRYGYFYGPGTAFDVNGELSKAIRKRAFPLIGGGSAVWSLIHVDDAAEATRLAIESAPAGIYNITDDKPSTLSEWLPGLADLLNARRPVRIPAWIGRFFVGESGLYLMTQARGARNARAKRVLGWSPAYPDWRSGFAATLRGAGA